MDKHTIAHLKTVMDKEQLIDFLADKLETADERSIACVNAFEGIETERFAGKSIGEFLAGEVRLNKAEPKPDGSFGFTFSGLAIQVMAEAFADQFKSSGAVNYLELLFEHSEIGPLTVTMQRVDGLTPAQKLAAVEDQLEAAQRDRNMHYQVSEKFRIELIAAEAELSAANEKLSKPVVLPDYRCSPDMHTKQYYETIGFNLGLDACKAVIKTAGFTVEGE